MKDLKYLCESIGLEAAAFYIVSTNPGEPKWLRSDFTMVNKLVISPKNDGQMLNEAIKLYQHGIASLQEELQMIQRFKGTFYGPHRRRGTKG